MDTPFIRNRDALAEAMLLLEQYGDDAGFVAGSRAEKSRDNDNVILFCHWRQIERVIVTLSATEAPGTIH